MKNLLIGCAAVGMVGGSAMPVLASAYSNAIQALNPSAYWEMQDSGTGVDSVAGNPNPLGNFLNVTFGVAGPTGLGLSPSEVGYGFNDNVSFSGANTNATPFVPVSGTGARTEIIWANEAVSSSNFMGGQSQNLSEYGVALSGNATDTNFGLNIFEGYTQNGTPLNYDTLELDLEGRVVEGTTTPIVPGTWNMLAVVFPNSLATAGDAQLYVNGVLQTNTQDIGVVPNTAPSPISNDLPFRVGHAYGDYGYDGSESELAFFDNALSGTQIQSLYATAIDGVSVPEPTSLSALGVLSLAMLRRRRR